LRRALRFPKGTRKSGEVRVQFKVAQNGRASSIRVVRSSGDKRLDAAAIATVKRAAPFPPIPPKAGRRSWTFTVPLAFRR
jgi:protein TonB